MDSYLKKFDELIEDKSLSDSQVISLSQARTFIAGFEKENELFKKVNKLIAQQRDDKDANINIFEGFIDELEKKFAIEDKIIKQINDYSDNYSSFDENGDGDPVY